MNGVAPLLVIAVGNPSRGDDALGPALLDALAEALRGPLGQALQAQGRAPQAEVELLGDFQLQVEHALDLAGRRAVLFVDASLAPVPDGAELTPLLAADGDPPMSHALRPQALLAVARRVLPSPPPPAWQLAVGGVDFHLGEGLSDAARAHLDRALGLAGEWLVARC